MAAEGIDRRSAQQDEQSPAAAGAAPQSTPMGFSGGTAYTRAPTVSGVIGF